MLAGMAALLILLAALLALVTYWKGRDAESDKEETVSVTDFDESALRSISYTFEGQAVELTYNEEAGAWRLSDRPDHPLQEALINNMVSGVCRLNAQRRLDGAGDLAEYGLESPTFTLTAQTDGETYTFLYGDQNQMTSDRYLKLSGEDTVYTVAEKSYAAFQYAPEDLFELEGDPSSSGGSTAEGPGSVPEA